MLRNLNSLGEHVLVTVSTSSALGGAETLLKRIIEFALYGNNRVFMLAAYDDFAWNNLPNSCLSAITKVNLPSIGFSAKYLDSAEIRELQNVVSRLKGLRELNGSSICIYAPYFNVLQMSMYAFRNIANACVFTGYLHPEAWPRELYSKISRFKQNIRPLRKNSLYHYQRELLKRLDLGSANWFMSDLVKKYHEYYYDVELPNSRVIPLPFDIPEIDPVTFDKARKKRDTLKVVWLGRFEYFKNPSIKKTYEALQQLIEKHKDLKVEFDLIGYGSEKYEKDIRKEVKTSGRLQVKYLGKIFPDRLPEVIAQYDVGVAMGTSALHIGVMGIPTIYVDASDENHYKEIKGCWLHREPIGLGSGVYGDIAGFRIDGREDMRILFEEMIAAPNLLEDYGVKDRNYVIENYDENKIMPQIIDAWTSSTFSPGDMEVYRYPPLKRFIRRTARKILRR